jgi:hypothetical protein
MPSDPSTFEQAVEALYHLNVGVIGTGAERHERPHKPLLLLAVLDLIAEGRATPDRIPWSQELRQRFTRYFQLVRKSNDQDAPENPFYYLRNEGWWLPVKIGANGPQPLEAAPLVRDGAPACARPSSPASFPRPGPRFPCCFRKPAFRTWLPRSRKVQTTMPSPSPDAPPDSVAPSWRSTIINAPPAVSASASGK